MNIILTKQTLYNKKYLFPPARTLAPLEHSSAPPACTLAPLARLRAHVLSPCIEHYVFNFLRAKDLFHKKSNVT